MESSPPNCSITSLDVAKYASRSLRGFDISVPFAWTRAIVFWTCVWPKRIAAVAKVLETEAWTSSSYTRSSSWSVRPNNAGRYSLYVTCWNSAIKIRRVSWNNNSSKTDVFVIPKLLEMRSKTSISHHAHSESGRSISNASVRIKARAMKLCSRNHNVCIAKRPGCMLARTSPHAKRWSWPRPRGSSFGTFGFTFNGGYSTILPEDTSLTIWDRIIPRWFARSACARLESLPYNTDRSTNDVTLFICSRTKLICSLDSSSPLPNSTAAAPAVVYVDLLNRSTLSSPSRMGKFSFGDTFGCGVVWERSCAKSWPKWDANSLSFLFSSFEDDDDDDDPPEWAENISLEIVRADTRFKPAGEEILSEYEDGNSRRRGVNDAPRSGYFRLFPEPSSERYSLWRFEIISLATSRTISGIRFVVSSWHSSHNISYTILLSSSSIIIFVLHVSSISSVFSLLIRRILIVSFDL